MVNEHPSWPPFLTEHLINVGICDCFISFPVDIVGTEATSCEEAHLFPTGAVGWSVAFHFDDSWDDLSYRTAVFWAGDVCEPVPLEGSTVTIPAIVFSKPWTELCVGVYGKECEGDAEDLARAKAIKARMKELNAGELLDPSTVKAALKEYRALVEELEQLKVPRKGIPTTWARLGLIVPGSAQENS